MDYNSAFNTPTYATYSQPENKWEDSIIWINKVCPKCKSSDGYPMTNDCGSIYMCSCGNSYKRFTYKKTTNNYNY